MKKYRYLLPAIVWSIVILWLISIPGNSFPKTPFINIPHFDKLVHAAIFAIFTFFLVWGLSKQKGPKIVEYHYTIALITGVVYGVFTEWIQLKFISGRSGEIVDLVADVVGCLIGLLVYFYMKRFFPSFLHKY